MANNLEDDFAIISGYLGAVTTVPSSHGADMTTASPVTATANVDGVTASSVDYGVIRCARVFLCGA